jgi:SRSO17 transposase
MAAIRAPERTAAQHQSLLHFVGAGGWSDDAVLGKAREVVLPKIECYGPIETWIIDDKGLPKKGEHSVGVSHQYCGQPCLVRVHVASSNKRTRKAAKEWLLIEWPKGEDAPTKYSLSTLPSNITFRIFSTLQSCGGASNAYLELKQEVGLGHYEGHGWRGFHHHATLRIAAYGFPVSERETIAPGPRSAAMLPLPPLSDSYRARGSSPTA